MCGRHVVKITQECGGQIDTQKTYVHDCSLSRVCTRTLVKRGGLKRKISQVRQKQCNADAYIIKRAEKAHVLSMRSHNRCHHQVKFIGKITCGCTLPQYSVHYTYSDGSCGRFTNAFSLTNDIGFWLMLLKYNFTLESSNILL